MKKIIMAITFFVAHPAQSAYEVVSLQGKDASMSVHQLLVQALPGEQVAAIAQDIATLPASVTLYGAMLAGDLIGLIAFEKSADQIVTVRHALIDPELFSENLVKELLSTIFVATPQVGKIFMVCPVLDAQTAQFLQDLGAISSPQLSAFADVYDTYEFVVTSKCKICEVLYGDDFWEQDGGEDWGSLGVNQAAQEE